MAILSDLKEPFEIHEIEWRIAQRGEKNGTPWAKVLAYVTNRAIMDRLDNVVGPQNWRNLTGLSFAACQSGSAKNG
jgi:hypothetical protein